MFEIIGEFLLYFAFIGVTEKKRVRNIQSIISEWANRMESVQQTSGNQFFIIDVSGNRFDIRIQQLSSNRFNITVIDLTNKTRKAWSKACRTKNLGKTLNEASDTVDKWISNK